MNAANIAGALVCFPSAVVLLCLAPWSWRREPDNFMDSPKTVGAFMFLGGMAFLYGAIFCIARLCGIHP